MEEERQITVTGAEPLPETHPAIAATATSTACDPEFDRIYRTFVPLLRGIAIRKFQIPYGDVDELVQDVFATYLTHAARVRQLRPYLVGGICNASRQYWREKDAQREVFSDADPDASATEDAVLEPLIRNTMMAAALSHVGPSCRETLRRFYMDGESAISIAESRNTTANSIHQLLNYCRGRVREAYRAMTEDA